MKKIRILEKIRADVFYEINKSRKNRGFVRIDLNKYRVSSDRIDSSDIARALWGSEFRIYILNRDADSEITVNWQRVDN